MNARTLLVLVVCAACQIIASGPRASTSDAPLVVVSRPGVWEGISQLIGYRDRLWFVNSVKFRNHNSADLYSYDPKTGDTRYERHLFSQDAGDPVVTGGLLYWPFEDARFSAGRGEYAVTNGRDWRWRVLPDGQTFHVHGMAARGSTLFAATSAWRGALQRSDDGGGSWEIVHDHPTAAGRVSRFTSLAFLDGTLYAGLTSYSEDGGKLFRLEENALLAVRGWPRGQRTTALHAHAGWLYAVNGDGDDRRVWRTDGTRAEPVTGLDGASVRAFASGPRYLWAVSSDGGGGALWRSGDGVRWIPVQRFDGAEPLDVDVYAGNVYVGTSGPDERGALWGPPAPVAAESPGAERMLPTLPVSRSDTAAHLQELRRGLVNVRDFKGYRVLLHAHIQPLALGGSPALGDDLARLLDEPLPPTALRAFGGALVAPLGRVHRWYLMWAMGLNGGGAVPPAYIAEPWRDLSNRAEKYFHPAPAAAWAAAQAGRWDEAVIDALIARLDADDAPRWLVGDYVGALSALSGEGFGYDSDAWRKWWSIRRAMVRVPAGAFMMGSDTGEPAEAPPHDVTIAGFYLDRYEVTNADFSAFVAATKHMTDAERADVGWHWEGEWRRVSGADWRHPHGPQSHIERLERHPVVQVSWNDAAAYCRWRGKRLPSEAEWERAARGAGGVLYAWGNAPPNGGDRYRASYGSDQCCRADVADGFLYTAPVGSFPDGRSPFGAEDMTGNVWEWVRDAFDEGYYRRSPPADPINTASGKSKVIRGGGWGNNPWGIRTTLRHANPREFGLSMVGFRCARSLPAP